MMVLAGTLAGSSLGLALFSGRILAVVGAVAGVLGTGLWALLSRRQVVGFFQECFGISAAR